MKTDKKAIYIFSSNDSRLSDSLEAQSVEERPSNNTSDEKYKIWAEKRVRILINAIKIHFHSDIHTLFVLTTTHYGGCVRHKFDSKISVLLRFWSKWWWWWWKVCQLIEHEKAAKSSRAGACKTNILVIQSIIFQIKSHFYLKYLIMTLPTTNGEMEE